MAYLGQMVRLFESRCDTETLDIVCLVPCMVRWQYRWMPTAFTVNNICVLNGECLVIKCNSNFGHSNGYPEARYLLRAAGFEFQEDI